MNLLIFTFLYQNAINNHRNTCNFI